jgi:hypothetical protein
VGGPGDGHGRNLPLYLHQPAQWRRELHDLKNAFTAAPPAFFLRALDTATRLGGTAPRGVKVLQRAYELLLEARNEFEREFA